MTMKILLFILIIVFLGISLLLYFELRDGGASQESLKAYRAALADLNERGIGAPEPGSEAEAAAIDRFSRLFADLSVPNVDALIGEVYADSLFFNDTVKTIDHLADLRAYMLATAQSVEACRVEMLDQVRSGEDFYFRWEMEIVFKALQPGLVDLTPGMTHIRFDEEGRVVLHQDFWDPARGIYEHIPVLGPILRKIKARL